MSKLKHTLHFTKPTVDNHGMGGGGRGRKVWFHEDYPSVEFKRKMDAERFCAFVEATNWDGWGCPVMKCNDWLMEQGEHDNLIDERNLT